MQRRLQDVELGNRRAALICAVLANIHRDPRKQPYTVEDFLGKAKKQQTVEEMYQFALGMSNYEVKDG